MLSHGIHWPAIIDCMYDGNRNLMYIELSVSLNNSVSYCLFKETARKTILVKCQAFCFLEINSITFRMSAANMLCTLKLTAKSLVKMK